MLNEIKKNADRMGLKVRKLTFWCFEIPCASIDIACAGVIASVQLVLANPRSEVIKKLNKSKFIETLGQEWIYLTVGEAVAACNFMLHTCKSDPQDSNVWAILATALEREIRSEEEEENQET